MNSQPMQQEGYDLMAAAFEVYNQLGSGFTEDVYQEALENELATQSITFQAQPELLVLYKGKPLKRKFRPDLVVLSDLVVELKTVSSITSDHEAQLLNYLKATGKPVGYLLNYGCQEKLEWKRFARTRKISGN